MIIHFSGLRNLDKSGACYSPSYWSAWIAARRGFIVPENELALIASGAPNSGRSAAQRGVNELALRNDGAA
jgi:hypothetical protein